MEVSLNVLFQAFFVAIVMDIVTMLVLAYKNNVMNSKETRNKSIKSLGEIILLLSFFVVSRLIPQLEGLVSIFVIGLALKSVYSALTNLSHLGVWTPESLSKLIESEIDKVDKMEKLPSSKSESK